MWYLQGKHHFGIKEVSISLSPWNFAPPPKILFQDYFYQVTPVWYVSFHSSFKLSILFYSWNIWPNLLPFGLNMMTIIFNVIHHQTFALNRKTLTQIYISIAHIEHQFLWSSTLGHLLKHFLDVITHFLWIHKNLWNKADIYGM